MVGACPLNLGHGGSLDWQTFKEFGVVVGIADSTTNLCLFVSYRLHLYLWLGFRGFTHRPALLPLQLCPYTILSWGTKSSRPGLYPSYLQTLGMLLFDHTVCLTVC